MAKYILNEHIALRSWPEQPYACYERGELLPLVLSRRDFLTLIHCDGTEDLDPSPSLTSLLDRHMIREAADGGERLSKWQQYRLFSNAFFPTLRLEITERCNYNCRHCFNAVDAQKPAEQMHLSEIDRLLEEAVRLGIENVCITGGEPFLHPDFLEIIRLISEKGLHLYSINTNGALITEELLSGMKDLSPAPLIKISFDGLGFHDWMRGVPHAEEQTLAAISLCVNKGFPVAVQMNMNRINEGCILESLRLLDRMGVQKTRIIRTSEGPRWLSQAENAGLTWTEYFDRCLEIAKAYGREEHSMSLVFWMFLALNTQEKSYRCAKIYFSEPEAYKDCLMCKSGLDVGADMKLYPCLQMSGYMKGRNICMGDVRNSPLMQYLEDSRYIELINGTVRDKIRHNEECGKCPVLRYCHGGCPAIGLIMHDDYFGRDDSSCIFFRDGYYGKIKKALTGYRNLAPMDEDYDAGYLENLDISEIQAGHYVSERP